MLTGWCMRFQIRSKSTKNWSKNRINFVNGEKHLWLNNKFSVIELVFKIKTKVWNFSAKMFLQEMFQKMKRSIPLKGVAAVFGGFLLQFTMGAFYSFGNMSTYMVSYMRQYGSPNLTYTDFIVVQSAWGMTQGTVMPFSGFLIRIIGEKAAMTLGATIFR